MPSVTWPNVFTLLPSSGEIGYCSSPGIWALVITNAQYCIGNIDGLLSLQIDNLGYQLKWSWHNTFIHNTSDHTIILSVLYYNNGHHERITTYNSTEIIRHNSCSLNITALILFSDLAYMILINKQPWKSGRRRSFCTGAEVG